MSERKKKKTLNLVKTVITPIKLEENIRDVILSNTNIFKESRTQETCNIEISYLSMKEVKKILAREVFTEEESRNKIIKSLKFSDRDTDGDLLLTKARFRIKFSDSESVAIQSGIKKFGWGKWSVIKANYDVLKNRTSVQIKDRARTMKSNGIT